MLYGTPESMKTVGPIPRRVEGHQAWNARDRNEPTPALRATPPRRGFSERSFHAEPRSMKTLSPLDKGGTQGGLHHSP